MPRRNRGAYLRFIKERGVFYIQWSEAGNIRKRSTGTANSGEAEAILSEFITIKNLAKQQFGPSDPENYEIVQALDLYAKLHAPHTAAPERIAFALIPLINFWGSSKVAEITKETCRAYVQWRNKKPGTMRRELGTLRAALNFAHTESRLTRVPFVELPDKPDGKDRWLTKSEAARLLNQARLSQGHTRLYLPLFIMMALYTGARKEAILSLRWSQVDLERRRINFNAVGTRKTNKGKVREQPIPDRLYTVLRLAKRRGSDLGYVIHRNGSRIKDIGDSNNGSFGRIAHKAGLIDVSPHILRHTCGTWMAQRGVSMFNIAGWLGQSVERTTELYAHHHPDYMSEAKQAADRR